MSVSSTTRRASIEEIVAEMDRRGKVIEELEAQRDRLITALKKISENDSDGLFMHTPQAMHSIATSTLKAEGQRL